MVEISKKYLQDLSGDLHKMEGKLGPIPEGKFLGHAARKIEAGWERLVRVFKEHKWISRQQHELTRLENKISSVKNDYEALSSKIEKAAHEGKLQDF
ncbi:MAG: hypothetical protein HWD61_13030 [Parachlamydiaceae bacterium]|nr:MAG: hypothetical protein HWD61_13030 [Parachlamydiaceae bacterium]